jgi:hypothetical protein
MQTNFLFILLLTALTLCSCKKDPDIDYCSPAIAAFKSYDRYEGTIYFCNAQPPQMAFIPGIVTTSFPDSTTLQIHLQADSIQWDTTLFFEINCVILEETHPNIFLKSHTTPYSGYFREDNYREDYTASISFSFGFPNCLNNTRFEGLGK